MIRSRAVWYGSIYSFLLAVLYFSTFDWLVRKDWSREDYNYCYLIPLVVVYLIWEKREAWLREDSIRSWGGLLVLLPGVMLYWFGELSGEFFSLYISSWLMVAGLLWLHAGWRKMKTMAFPLFVSLFLFPLPHFLNTKLTFSLKLLSSEIGVKMIQLIGMSAYREGNVIDLGFTKLQVVDACSGLRYIIPLFLMGVLMAYFYRTALWKRVIIAFSTIPLSIITNSLRIALTAILYPLLGPAAAEGFFHDFSGWVIFMVSMGVLLGEIWVLGKIMPRPGEGFILKRESVTGDSGVISPESHQDEPAAGGKRPGGFLAHPQFLAAVAILVVTLALSSMVNDVEKKPERRSFSQFPLVIGQWEGKRQLLEQEIIDELDLSDYVAVNYWKPEAPSVDIYIAYYESQRKGASIHSPETCLPGGGWIFSQDGTKSVSLPGKNPSSITVKRVIMEKSGMRHLVYFWFSQRGRILTNAYELKLYNLWDGLVKKRTDGALIRVLSPVDASEKIEDADQRLQSFIGEMMPLLDDYIPGFSGN